MAASLIGIILALAMAGQAPETWTTVTPPGAGFTIQAPGTSKPDPNHPMKFSFVTEDSGFIVEVDPLDERLTKAVADGNQALIVGYIAFMRDELVKNLNGKMGSSSAGNFDGYPRASWSPTSGCIKLRRLAPPAN